MVVMGGWKGASHRKAFSKPISDGSQGHKPQPTLELIKSKKEMNQKKIEKGGGGGGGGDLKVTPWINKTDHGQVSEVVEEGGFLGARSECQTEREGRREG